MTKLKTDQTLFATILAMVAFGLVMVYSSSSAVAVLRYDYQPYHFAIRQLGWAIVSIGAMMLFKRLDYRRLNSAAWAFSGLGLVAICDVHTVSAGLQPVLNPIPLDVVGPTTRPSLLWCE